MPILVNFSLVANHAEIDRSAELHGTYLYTDWTKVTDTLGVYNTDSLTLCLCTHRKKKSILSFFLPNGETAHMRMEDTTLACVLLSPGLYYGSLLLGRSSCSLEYI